MRRITIDSSVCSSRFIDSDSAAGADDDFVRVAVGGHNLSGNVLANCAADVALYTSATAGKLDDDATAQTKIDGAVTVAANGGATAAVEVLLTAPRSATF